MLGYLSLRKEDLDLKCAKNSYNNNYYWIFVILNECNSFFMFNIVDVAAVK